MTPSAAELANESLSGSGRGQREHSGNRTDGHANMKGLGFFISLNCTSLEATLFQPALHGCGR